MLRPLAGTSDGKIAPSLLAVFPDLGNLVRVVSGEVHQEVDKGIHLVLLAPARKKLWPIGCSWNHPRRSAGVAALGPAVWTGTDLQLVPATAMRKHGRRFL